MKKLKKIRQSALLALLLVITVFLGYIRFRADGIGKSVGEVNGRLVGTAVGSFKGVTLGISEGKEAGERAGLSASDITAEMKGMMESAGRLEVLAAGVSLKNINKIGDAYKGLYIINGDAVFSVDLTRAEISLSQDGNDISIRIPEPELDLYLDQSSTEKLAETQNFSFSLGAEDGLNAYLNSMAGTTEKIKETMVNYEALFDSAKESAKSQVRQLASAICGKAKTVHVQFK